MNELTWPEWQEQLAYDSIANDPIERIAAILQLGFAAMCQSWGVEVTTDDFEPDASRKTGEYANGYTSPDDQVAMLRPQIDRH